MMGDREAEAALHERFADERLHGEWFERRGELASWLSYASVVYAPMAELNRLIELGASIGRRAATDIACQADA